MQSLSENLNVWHVEVSTEVKMEQVFSSRRAEDEAVSTRTAEEEAVLTRTAEEDGMLAGGDTTKLEVLDEADCLFDEPVSSTRRFSSRLREVFLDSIKCKVCGESFTMMTDLVDHLRINAGRHGLMSDQEIQLSPQRKPQTKSKGGQFKCDVCEKTFPSTMKLLQHKVIHSLGVIKCPVCSQTFLTLSDLQKHKQVHSKENVFDCDMCDGAFQTRSALFTHQSTLHAITPEDPVEINGKKKNACRYCDKAYKSPAHLREHERVHTNEKPFACVKCGKAFHRGSSLTHHMKVHSQNQTYPCIKCGTAFKSYFHLSRHRQFHKDRPFSCGICRKMYATKAKLSKHTSQHKKDSLICDECNKKFKSKLELSRHKRVHKRVEKRHICDVCNKSYKQASHLQKHKLSHRGTSKKPHVCRFCQKSYSKITQLNLHLRTHAKVRSGKTSGESDDITQENKYDCGICSNSFETYYRMRKHKQMHKDRPYMCDSCEETFRVRAELRRHKQSECSDGYVCETCNKSFSTQHALQSHNIQHALEKPYMCSVCHESFKTTKLLKLHMQVHMEEKILICPVCDKEFTGKSNLKRHKKICDKRIRSLSLGKVQTNATPDVSPSKSNGSKITGADRLKCGSCKKIFKRVSDLKEHEKTHLRQSNFLCNICGKAFKGKQLLRQHSNQHKKLPLKQSPRLNQQLRVHEADEGNTEMPEVHTQLANLTSLVHGDSQINLLPEFVLSSGVQVPGNLNPSNETQSFQQPSESCVQLISLNSDAPVDALNATQLFTHLGTAVVHQPESSVSSPDMMCPFCNEVFRNSLECEVHMSSHDATQPSTSSICREALDALYSRGNPRGHTGFVYHNSDTLNNPQIRNTTEKVAVENSESVSDSDNDFGLPDFSDEDDEPHVEMSCTEILNSLSSPGVPDSSRKDLMVVHQLLPRMKKCQLLLQKITLFPCDVCSKSFQSQVQLDQHRTSHVNNDREQPSRESPEHRAVSNADSTSFPSTTELNKPTCGICSKSFQKNYSLQRHLQSHTKTKPHRCDKCGRTFKHKCHVKEHQRSSCTFRGDSGKNRKLFKCDICSKGFISSLVLKAHQRAHSDKNLHDCDRCGKVLYRGHLKTHQRDSCKGTETGTICTNVSKQTSVNDSNKDNDEMEERMEKKALRGSVQCEICKRKFNQKLSLQRHLIKHSDKSRYECDQCNRTYKHKHHMQKHQMTSCRGPIAGTECNPEQENSRDSRQPKSIEATGEVEVNQRETCQRPKEGTFLPPESGEANDNPIPADRTDDQSKSHVEPNGSTITEPDVRIPTPRQEKKGQAARTTADTYKKTQQLLKCRICSEEFVGSFSLEKHFKSHSDTHPHKCDKCERRYKHKNHMKTHQKDCCKGAKDETLFSAARSGSAGESRKEKDVVNDSNGDNDGMDKRIEKKARQGKSIEATGEVEVHQTESRQGPKEGTLLPPELGAENDNHISADTTDNQSESHGEPINSTITEQDVVIPTLRKEKKEQAARTTADTNKKTQQLLKCRICSEEFVGSFSLEMHFKSHSDTHPHKCDKCGRRYKHKHHMKTHQKDSCKGAKDDRVFSRARSQSAGVSRKEKDVVNDSSGDNDGTDKPIEKNTRHGKHVEATVEVEVHQTESCQGPKEGTLLSREPGAENDNHISADTTDNQSESHGEPIKSTVTEQDAVIPTLTKEKKEQAARTTADTNKKTQQLLKCRICSEEFLGSFSLEMHFKSHSDTHPHKCDKCGRRYKHKHHMKTHQKDSCKGAKDDRVFSRARSQSAGVSREEKDVVNDSSGDNDGTDKRIEKNTRHGKHVEATVEVEVHQTESCQGPKEGTLLPPELGEANDNHISAVLTDVQSESRREPKDSTIPVPDLGIPTLRKEKREQAARTTADTNKKVQQLLKCRICSEEFSNSFSLEMHFMSHSDTHPHKCDKCGRRYKHKYHMKTHQKDSCKGAKDETAFSTARRGRAGESRKEKDVVNDSSGDNDGTDKCIEKNLRQGKHVEATVGVEVHQTEFFQRPKEGTLLSREPGAENDNHISADSTDNQSESHGEPIDSTIPVPDLGIPTLRKEKREQAARTTADTNKKIHQLLKCRICSEEFTSSFSLEMHFKSHSDTHPHKCDKCGRRYKHKHHMKAHQRDSCKGVKDETAFLTARRSAGESRKEKDVVIQRRNSGSIPVGHATGTTKARQANTLSNLRSYVCDCGETFKESFELNRHRLKYHGNKTVDSDSEDENFLNEASEDFEQSNGETSDASKRMSTKLQQRSCKRNGTANVKLFQRRALERKASTNGRMNPNVHKCEMCSKEFAKRRLLVKHAKSHADERPYSCKACGKSYQHFHLLRHHQTYACHKSKHAEKKPQQNEVNLPVKCQCCSKSFQDALKLERHENTHFPDNKYTCGCGQAFKQKYELKRHRDKYHCAGNSTNTTYIKLVQCEVCLKKIFKSHFREHMKCHSEDHPFKCNGCGKRYTQKDHMEQHQAKSCKKVPIVMVCTDKRPYKCDRCKADFTKQSMLMKHQHKVHNVGTPGTKYQFKCHLCPKTFNFQHQFKRHENAHLRRGEATHKCVCGQFFKRQSTLWRHLSQDHVTPRLHLCNICDQMFSSGKFLRCHMRKQHDTRPFKCHKCSNTFLESKHLKDHRRVHKSKRRFKCGSCRRDFTKQSKLVSHELSHNNHTDTASCELCGKRFKGKQSLSRHKLMYHPGDYLCRDQEYMRSKPNIKCGLCGKTFWQQSSLVKHSNRTHHKLIPYACVPCNKTFSTFSEMKAHEVEHSNFTCKICDARLENLYRLRNHCLLHTRNKNFICEICGKSSTNKKGLRLHQLRHLGKSLFICEICDGGFKSKADLDAHVSTHNLDKVYVCDVCGTLTSSHLTLMNHMKSHGGDKNLECKTCGKGFRNKRYLLAHSKIHNKGAQGHNCTVCGKSFRRKCFLTMHLHTHQDKQRSCEICNKVFKKASYLTTHMLVHNNVKPYSCKFCDRTFFKLKVRNQHHNVHTKEKPYKCDVCGDCFAATGTLYRHKKAHEKKNSKWERDRLAKEEPKERRAKSSVKDAPIKRKQRKKKIDGI